MSLPQVLHDVRLTTTFPAGVPFDVVGLGGVGVAEGAVSRDGGGFGVHQ
jgi:hypothetical protein